MITPRWRVALFLFVAAGLNYADRTALSSVIPPLRADLGITDAQIGLAGMLFLWCYALASPFAGNLADRFSRSKIVVWSLVAWSVVTIFTGLIESVIALFVMRIALGLPRASTCRPPEPCWVTTMGPPPGGVRWASTCWA
jgi:sugar phosphate permease